MEVLTVVGNYSNDLKLSTTQHRNTWNVCQLLWKLQLCPENGNVKLFHSMVSFCSVCNVVFLTVLWDIQRRGHVISMQSYHQIFLFSLLRCDCGHNWWLQRHLFLHGHMHDSRCSIATVGAVIARQWARGWRQHWLTLYTNNWTNVLNETNYSSIILHESIGELLYYAVLFSTVVTNLIDMKGT